MAITVFTNAFLIDCTGKDPVEGAAVVVEGERIKDVIASGKVGPLPGKIDTVDLKGRTLMPGLTDAHVHVCAVEGNIPEQHRHNPPSLIAAKALRRMEQCLMQGFTTVRDAGGADYGFREAAESGLYPGPRMLVSGRPLSQTGGHADKRRRAEWIEPVDCCVGMVGHDRRRRGRGPQGRPREPPARRGPDQDHGVRAGRCRRATSSTPRSTRWRRCGPRWKRRARSASTCWPTPTRAPRSGTRSRPACAASSTATCSTRGGRAGHQGGRRLPRADHGHLRGDLARGQELRHRRPPDPEDQPGAASRAWRASPTPTARAARSARAPTCWATCRSSARWSSSSRAR